jgi:hypothetical protein
MKEENKIDRMIREGLKVEHPSSNFTGDIMKKIEMAESTEEKALRSLLKRNAVERPSENFTARVMHQVEKASVVESIRKPIIGKKAWIFISVFVATIFIYALSSGERNNETDQVIDTTVQRLDTLLTSSLSWDMPSILTSPLLGLSLFALSSLLFLDYFMRNQRVSLKI